MDVQWNKASVEGLLQQLAGDPEDPRERKRQRILSAARELFAESGYRKTSVDEIARHAHVAKGTVYLYFRSKPDILVAVIAAAELEMLEQFLPLFEEGTPAPERFERFIRDTFLVWAQSPLLARMFAGDRELLLAAEEAEIEGVGTGAEVLRDLTRHLLDPIAREEGWSEDALDVRARTVVAVMNAVPVFLDPRARAGLTLDQFARSLASLLTYGVLGGNT